MFRRSSILHYGAVMISDLVSGEGAQQGAISSRIVEKLGVRTDKTVQLRKIFGVRSPLLFLWSELYLTVLSTTGHIAF